MRGLRAHRSARPELPLVPLIDVLVMLVFFSFATMQFREKVTPTMNLTLPKVESAGQVVLKSSVIISIDKTGKMRLTIQGPDGKMVMDKINLTLAELGSLSGELARVDKSITVLVRSDELVPLKDITAILDLCNKNGLRNVKLHTR